MRIDQGVCAPPNRLSSPHHPAVERLILPDANDLHIPLPIAAIPGHDNSDELADGPHHNKQLLHGFADFLLGHGDAEHLQDEGNHDYQEP
jgi:hypothetical protein